MFLRVSHRLRAKAVAGQRHAAQVNSMVVAALVSQPAAIPNGIGRVALKSSPTHGYSSMCNLRIEK